jgi:hypothetical protein
MDLKSQKYIEQNGLYAHCKKPLPQSSLCQLAHILPQRKWIKEKYGEDLIQHELNMKLTHPTDICNSGVQMSPNKTALVEKHIEMIKEAIRNG